MKLLLGSNSPRRKELLQQLGYEFSVVSINCEEAYPDNLSSEKIAGFLAEKKANFFRNLEKDEVLITADTIVALENEILGKPKNQEQALEMLMKISGKTHQVYTAISFKNLEKTITKTDVADVTVETISEEEASFYISKYQPFDKAGSYGIQEWLGMAKINRIDGSFYTIMGLPTHLVYNTLSELEYISLF